MYCKHCNEEYKTGYGTFCSRSCCNKSRGSRSEETKSKIKETNKKRAANRSYDKLKIANSNPGKRIKTSRTWAAKRDYNVAHPQTIKRWVKAEVKGCQACGLENWGGVLIPLEIHHIDGNRENNLRENLQIMCPNCHSLTPNWRGRKNNLL